MSLIPALRPDTEHRARLMAALLLLCLTAEGKAKNNHLSVTEYFLLSWGSETKVSICKCQPLWL